MGEEMGDKPRHPLPQRLGQRHPVRGQPRLVAHPHPRGVQRLRDTHPAVAIGVDVDRISLGSKRVVAPSASSTSTPEMTLTGALPSRVHEPREGRVSTTPGASAPGRSTARTSEYNRPPPPPPPHTPR